MLALTQYYVEPLNPATNEMIAKMLQERAEEAMAEIPDRKGVVHRVFEVTHAEFLRLNRDFSAVCVLYFRQGDDRLHVYHATSGRAVSSYF